MSDRTDERGIPTTLPHEPARVVAEERRRGRLHGRRDGSGAAIWPPCDAGGGAVDRRGWAGRAAVGRSGGSRRPAHFHG
jgi:hypothetical protein